MTAIELARKMWIELVLIMLIEVLENFGSKLKVVRKWIEVSLKKWIEVVETDRWFVVDFHSDRRTKNLVRRQTRIELSFVRGQPLVFRPLMLPRPLKRNHVVLSVQMFIQQQMQMSDYMSISKIFYLWV